MAFVLNSVTKASSSSAKRRFCSKPERNASLVVTSWLGRSVGSARPNSLEPLGVSPVTRASGVRLRSLTCVQASEVAMRARSIRDLGDGELRGKRVFLRSDLNVPLDGKRITDDTRVRASVPTIKYLMDKGAKVIVVSHLGRPKGGFEDKYSLAPVAARLSELLGKPVRMAKDCIGDTVASEVSAMSPGDVLLLENVRFYPEEEKNDPEFARKLAANADLYVNDAFGTAHRAHASTEGVTAFLKPAVAGFLLEKELDYLSNAIDNPKRPFAAIVGGSKVSSKIGVLEKLLQKCDSIIIGGGMVFTFLRARGLNTGSSLVEEDKIELARSIEEQARKRGIELMLPVDVVIADKFDNEANTKVVPVEAIPDGWMGLDNGPETTKMIQEKLRTMKTVLWNGPLGVFEMPNFAKGTFAIADTLAEITQNGCITIVGGGDSVAAMEQSGKADKVSHISTGGGAALELIEGRVLPGVAALQKV
jgi:phosphoglycerate kinase